MVRKNDFKYMLFLKDSLEDKRRSGKNSRPKMQVTGSHTFEIQIFTRKSIKNECTLETQWRRESLVPMVNNNILYT